MNPGIMFPFLYKIRVIKHTQTEIKGRTVEVWALTALRALESVWDNCGEDEVISEIWSFWGSKKLI